jgi:hypothetical protein
MPLPRAVTGEFGGENGAVAVGRANLAKAPSRSCGVVSGVRPRSIRSFANSALRSRIAITVRPSL